MNAFAILWPLLNRTYRGYEVLVLSAEEKLSYKVLKFYLRQASEPPLHISFAKTGPTKFLARANLFILKLDQTENSGISTEQRGLSSAGPDRTII